MTVEEIAFDKYAAKGAYHWVELYGPVHRRNAFTIARYACVRAALAQHGLGRGQAVLDIGCGDGALAGLLAATLGVAVSGVDTVPRALELARAEFAKRGLKGTFDRIDGYAYPHADASFDAAVCSDVIEHVGDPRALLREAWRVTKPGGVVVMTTPVRYTEAPLDRLHVQEFFPCEFERLCAETLGVPVTVRLSHPVAWLELYVQPTWLGRIVRLGVNMAAAAGHNVFETMGRFRAASTQTMIAVKPADRS
jgi:2-polyprenyl-3-methyl-5-hydroxy-6-metoxy-1,4-benzoquinol methylase